MACLCLGPDRSKALVLVLYDLSGTLRLLDAVFYVFVQCVILKLCLWGLVCHSDHLSGDKGTSSFSPVLVLLFVALWFILF